MLSPTFRRCKPVKHESLRCGRVCAVTLICVWGARASAAQVIDNAALANEQRTDWPAYGRTFSEGHYSPLTQITTDSIKRLGLAWTLNLDVTNSITAPLEVDGVVYVGAGHGIIYAADARSGQQLWRYDAQAPQAAHLAAHRVRGAG